MLTGISSLATDFMSFFFMPIKSAIYHVDSQVVELESTVCLAVNCLPAFSSDSQIVGKIDVLQVAIHVETPILAFRKFDCMVDDYYGVSIKWLV